MKLQKNLLALLSAGLLTLASCSGPLGLETSGTESVVPAEARALSYPTSNILYMENYADLRVFAGAKAEVLYGSNQEMGYSQVYIHYGFNGWQSVADAPVKIDSPSSPYIHGQITIPSWATQLDYVFYSVQADGSKLWDNNRGRDWHVKVYTSSVETFPSTTSTTVYYISKYPAAKIHWGVNGWLNTQDTLMTKSQALPSGYNKFTVTLTPAKTSDLINFCFTNGSGAWDNNGGQDWITSLATFRTEVYPTNNGAFYQGDLMGEPMKAYLEGKYVGDILLTAGTTYFATASTGQAGNWTFVLDVIKNGNRYTGTASKKVTAAGSVGFAVQVTPWNQ